MPQAATQATSPVTKALAEFCTVYDLNAKNGVKRTHQVEDSYYELDGNLRGPGTSVPLKHAVYFIKVPTFVVINPLGNRLLPDTPADEEIEIQGLVLPPHLVIAKLFELHFAALLVRARKLPGGHVLSTSTGRERVIDFIMAGGIKDNVRQVSPLDAVGLPVNVKPGQTVEDAMMDTQDARELSGQEQDIIDDDGEEDGAIDAAEAILGPKQLPDVG